MLLRRVFVHINRTLEWGHLAQLKIAEKFSFPVAIYRHIFHGSHSWGVLPECCVLMLRKTIDRESLSGVSVGL